MALKEGSSQPSGKGSRYPGRKGSRGSPGAPVLGIWSRAVDTVRDEIAGWCEGFQTFEGVLVARGMG